MGLQEAITELNHRIIFGREAEIVDELIVASTQDAEKVLFDPDHEMAFEVMKIQWAKVVNENEQLLRYFARKKSKFVRDRGLELTLNPVSRKPKVKDYEITAMGENPDSPLLKIKVTSGKLSDAMKEARSISKAFLEFRSGGKIKDFEFAGDLEESDGLEDEATLPILSDENRPRLKDHPDELLRRARELYKKGSYLPALELFCEAIPVSKPSLDDMITASKAAIESKRFVIAEDIANTILAKQERNPEALMIKGLIYTEWQNYDEDVDFWRTKFTENPDDQVLKACFEKMKSIQLRKSTRSIAEERESENISPSKPLSEQRSWVRRPCDAQIYIRGPENGEAKSFHICSLSAGGALLQKTEDSEKVPDKFQFFMSLSGFESIFGLGEKVYETGSGQVGLQFVTMAPKSRNKLNEEVLKLPNLKEKPRP